MSRYRTSRIFKLFAAALLALPAQAPAQTGATIKQSGYVTPNHVTCWVTNGVVKDCGTTQPGNVVGPASSAIGDLVCFNNTTGTIIADCPNALFAGKPFASVFYYGAVGDGQHPTQDTNAINAAYAHIQNAGGGTVYFDSPPVKYCSTGITVSGNVAFRGAAPGLSTTSNNIGGATLSACGQDLTPLTIVGLSIVVENIGVEGGPNGSTTPALKLAAGSGSFIIQNVNVTQGFQNILSDGSADGVLLNVQGINAFGEGLMRVQNGNLFVLRSRFDQGDFVGFNGGDCHLNPLYIAFRSGISPRVNGGTYTQCTIVSYNGWYIQATSVSGVANGTSGPTLPSFYYTNFVDGTVTWQLVAPVSYYGTIISDSGSAYIEQSDFTGPFFNCLLLHSTGGTYTTGPQGVHMGGNGNFAGRCVSHVIEADPGTVDTEIIGGNYGPCGASGCYGFFSAADPTYPPESIKIVGASFIQTYNGVGISGPTSGTHRVNATVVSNGFFGLTGTALVFFAGAQDFEVIGNLAGGSTTWGNNGACGVVSTGGSDYYNIQMNDCHGAGAGFVDGGTGVNKEVQYNF